MSRRVIAAFVFATMFLVPSTVALAIDLANPAFAPSGELTSIPIGHMEFCRSRPLECVRNPVMVPAVALDQVLWSELLGINARYNAEVRPVSDDDLYQVAEFWTYPNRAGDCEDYVLAKRRALLDAGWPASTLLIAVVRQASGEGHAVLMVRTDRGDLVLDNQDSKILTWSETPYFYIKRQSQADAGQWVDLQDNRSTIVAQSADAAVGATQP
ncbi:transglutaminase-like cysteine peptidase [Devosia sp.]|uniref:transglutaminase-like cysteine peptidase n=1 Tax=Devosia sp. TaxID=1871048 RepID=UPI0019E990E9|nr:transglutaminase-like cysteine peptidase [Devosia sp.]MBE0577849.1 transglutaminase-like cysteine peptidase [Devosia sp.]